MINVLSSLIKIFFIGIFVYVATKINFSKFSINIFDKNFFFAFLFFFLFHFFRAYKVKYLIILQNKLALKIYFIGFFFGFLTPGRIGDFLKIFYVKKKNRFLTFKIFFYDKIVDIYWISFFSFISILYLVKINFSILLILSFLLLIISYKLNYAVLKYLKLIINIPKFIYLNFFSISSLIFYSLGCYFVFRIFTNGIDMTQFSIFILALFITLLPISFNGLGTRELIFLYFFQDYNITNDEILISSFIIFLMINFLFSVFGMIIYATNKRVIIEKKLLSKYLVVNPKTNKKLEWLKDIPLITIQRYIVKKFRRI